MIECILVYLGCALVAVGAISDLIAGIAINRFPNFYVRLHAVTIGTIGGAFYPLIGIALISFGAEFLGPHRFFMGGSALVTAFLVLVLAPAGSHSLARATHRKGIAVDETAVVDHLKEDGRGE